MSSTYRDFTFTTNSDSVKTVGYLLRESNILYTLSGDDEIYETYHFYNAGKLATGEGSDSISINREYATQGTVSAFFNKGTIETEQDSDFIQSIQSGGNAAIYNQKKSTKEPGIINTGSGNDKISGSAGNVGIFNEGGSIALGDGDDIIEGVGGTSSGLYNTRSSYTGISIGSISTGNGDDSIKGEGGSGIFNFGILNTGGGDDKIEGTQNSEIQDHIRFKHSGGGIENRGGAPNGYWVMNSNAINTGEGDDQLSGRGNVGIRNFSLLSTGDGKDRVLGFGGSIGIWNEVEIDTGSGDDYIKGEGSWAGIANNGIINTGSGNDIVDAIKGGFRFEEKNPENPKGSGIVDLGNDDDRILGFGTGEFIGGDGSDIILLPEGLYEIGANSITRSWDVMKVTGFEKVGGINGGVFDFTPGRIEIGSDGIAKSNNEPTDLQITASSFYENISAGSVAATLSSTDENEGDTHTYSLVSGSGDIDNSSFTINGNELRIKESPDFENKSSYSIRLQTKDSGGLTFEKAFTLSVNDLEEMPAIQSIEDVSTQKKVNTFKIQEPVAFAGQNIDTVIVGTKKKDKITGTSAGEALAGMKGKDVLKGGKGADGFLFNQSGGFGNKHADQIKDFNSDEGDSILVNQDIFGVSKNIKLKSYAGKNKVKKATKSKNDFIYDNKKGFLYFNENGKKKGWGDGGLFAKLQGAPELGASDFTIV